jgi:SNF2 family DNA or RNA helicase
LIVDEAHRSRNPSKTQQALRNNEARKRLLLTGSLFYNQPSDAAAPINLVAGQRVLPSDPEEFRKRFVQERHIEPGFLGKLVGDKPRVDFSVNPDQRKHLQAIFKKYVDYHPGSTENFPRRVDETFEVPMTRRQKEIYDTLLGKAPKWVSDRVRSGLPPTKSEIAQLNRFLQGTRQVSNSTAPYHLDRPAENPKIDKAFSELNTLLSQNPRAKAVVFSNYLDAGINPYKAKLDEAQIPYGEFTGEMNKSKRDQMVRDYNANKLRALLLSRAGGEGLDLKGTRAIQLLEPAWNEESLKQVIGRGIRYKSHADLPEDEREVRVQRFVSQNPRRGLKQRLHLAEPDRSVDQYLLGLARQKEQLNQQFRDLLHRESA